MARSEKRELLIMVDPYQDARIGAERETHLARSVFPVASPFTFDEATNPDFWPD
jgi:hypothetical protein